MLVAAEDVERGKPAPDPFLLGARRLGVAPHDCLVFEDTLAGLQSAASAGMASVVVTTTHLHPLKTDVVADAVADVVAVLDYDELRAESLPAGGLRLRHSSAR